MRLSLFPKMLGEIFAHPFSKSILIKSGDYVYAARRYADLSGKRLRDANLQYADLRAAILEGADLRGANLQGANLEFANLQGANLQRADLQGANLQRADLQGANLLGAQQITQDQIESTMGSNETKLPVGLNRPELWSESLGEQWGQ